MLGDWPQSLRRWRLWTALGNEDLKERYRRTVFGVLWVVISFTVFVAVKVAIFGQLAAVSTAEFGLFVTIGFGLWSFINQMVTEGCTAYIQARPWILGTVTPYPVFILQTIYRNCITFAMTMFVVVGALFFKPTSWTATMLWAVPALLIYPLTSVWLTCLLAPLCARFRDLHHATQTFMRLLFFATPILWMPAANSRLAAIARWNPVSHFVDLVRDPLLYNTVPWDSWGVVLAINVIGFPLGFLVYARSRPNVVFWI